MTHMRWLHGQSGHESTDHTHSVVQCVGGLRAWPIDWCSGKDVGKHERKTLIPRVETNRKKTEATSMTTREQHATTHVALTTHRDRTGQGRAGQGRAGQGRAGDVDHNLFRLSEQDRSAQVVPRWNGPRQPRSDLRTHFEEVCGAPTVLHLQVCERAHIRSVVSVCLPISQSSFSCMVDLVRGICQFVPYWINLVHWKC